MAWLSFTELDTTVVPWSDWLDFCAYGFSVSALWCPLTIPTVLLGFLLPWMWGISLWLLQQSAAAAPYLGRGVSPHGRPSWPWTWSSSSRPSCAPQLPLLVCGVAPLCLSSLPRRWGSSSWPVFIKDQSRGLHWSIPDPPVLLYWWICLFLHHYHTISLSIALLEALKCSGNSPQMFLSSNIVLAILCLLALHVNFRIHVVHIHKTTCWDFGLNCTESI